MTVRRTVLKALAAAGVFGPAGISGLVQNALANGINPVPPGLHTVTTGPGAEAIYVIGQDAYLQRDSSSISFAGDATKNLLRVVSGKILAVFGKGERTIQVSTATIGIRGTGCYIEDSPAKVGAGGTAIEKAQTYFCLCYGTVDLNPKANPAEREIYSTTHHDKPMLIHDDPEMAKCMAPASVMNHTDAELVMLENLVGRWPPFGSSSGAKY
jgi:hypothetical protein